MHEILFLGKELQKPWWRALYFPSVYFLHSQMIRVGLDNRDIYTLLKKLYVSIEKLLKKKIYIGLANLKNM